MEQLCSSSGTTLECGVTSSCCLASGLLEVLLLHVPTYSVMLWYIQCHRSTGDQPRNYRTGRGKLAFTLETSDNCFAPTIPDLREAFELAHFASPFPGFRIQSLDQTCQVTLGILVYQELLSLQTCTCMYLGIYVSMDTHNTWSSQVVLLFWKCLLSWAKTWSLDGGDSCVLAIPHLSPPFVCYFWNHSGHLFECKLNPLPWWVSDTDPTAVCGD